MRVPIQRTELFKLPNSRHLGLPQSEVKPEAQHGDVLMAAQE